ncbi:MAG: peptidylprolyl isomerase [Fibrobacter sp.]|jgi:parvulin-like peptidyl-prolyl isomerase|nr:peptidylprolyl isomerase [Fibrobacter sp.]
MRSFSFVGRSAAVLLLLAGLVSAQLMSSKNFDVVRVGKTGISQGKVDSLAVMLGEQQARGRTLPPEAVQQLRWAVIDNLVGQELLKLEIEKQKMKVDSKKVDSLVAVFKGQFPDENTFQAELKRTGITLKQFREKIEQQLLSESLLEKKVPYPKDPTDKEIAAYWELNKTKVPVNDTISGAQIMLKRKAGESAQALNDKKDMLKGYAAQVRAGKASFATLAAQYSDDPEARQTGGVMSKFIASSKGADFAKAISKLKVGEISDVFTTKDGVYIFMLTEKNDGQFDSYKHQIDYILRVKAEQERQLAIKSFLDQLAKTYPVQYLNKDYTPPDAIGGK